jgi:colanic acid/amylovoran biosynthesis glycosyltransferase
VHVLGVDLMRRAYRRGCPRSLPVASIPPAIDAEFFDPGERVHRDVAGTVARPLRILSVGRLEWKKGYEYALQAVQQLQASGCDCEYRIVGDGDYAEPLRFAAHELGLDTRVQFLGTLSRDEVHAQMRWADVFLHAAVSEGFCNAALEAQAMRLPVVSSDADGLAENVADGYTGFIVPRRDPAALAACLRQLAGDAGLRQKLGAAGRRRVREQFAVADQIQAFVDLYDRVVAGTAAYFRADADRVRETAEMEAAAV